MAQIRQGDLLFERVDGIPEEMRGRLRRRRNGFVAEGEATGHMHEIDGWSPSCGAAILENIEDEGDMFVTTDKDISVKHPEHGPVDLATGTWHVTRQQEYTPEMPRRVSD